MIIADIKLLKVTFFKILSKNFIIKLKGIIWQI